MIALLPFAVAALIATATPSLDTVFLRNGGRVRGTVIEEDPARGISLQLPTGELRKLLPAEIARVEYGDNAGGAGPDPVAPAAAPAAPSPPPTATTDGTPVPPAATPTPPDAQPAPPPTAFAEPVPAGPAPYAPPAAVTFAVSLFSLSSGGDAEGGRSMKDFTSAMGGLGLEAGLRLDEHFTLGAFLDFSAGEPGPWLETWCADRGLACTTGDLKLGLLVRYAFSPSDWQTPWVGLGLGLDALVAVPDDPGAKAPAYVGYEPLRISAGWDYRGKGQLGVGLFATASWSRYGSVDEGTGAPIAIDDRRGHSWFQVGVRGILLP